MQWSVGWPNLFRVGKTKERQLSVDPATGSFSLSVAGSVAHLELTTAAVLLVVHGEELSNGSTAASTTPQTSSRPDIGLKVKPECTTLAKTHRDHQHGQAQEGKPIIF